MARRRPVIVALVPMLVALTACSSPSSPDRQPPDAVAPQSTTASALIDLTNQQRTRTGLAALRANSRLIEAAQLHATQIAEAGRLEHTLSDARFPRIEDRLAAAGYQWQAIGENLAAGQRSPEMAIESWMQSASHRANILNGTFVEVGAGHALDSSGRPYYVQVFARPH